MISDAARARNRVASLSRPGADPAKLAAAREELASIMAAVRAGRHCSVDGCERPYRAKGFCATHLVRANRFGDAQPVVPVPDHRLSHHPLYGTWWSMLDRCENARCHAYRLYGQRGISVCPDWHDVTVFISWVEQNLGPRAAGMSLDRIDNDGSYEPGNVRWATKSEQRRNQRPRSRRVPG